MDTTIISAVIGAIGAIIAAIVAAIVAIYLYHKKKKDGMKKNKEKQIIELHLKKEDIPISPISDHPVFLNPDEYDIDTEEYFVTMGAFLQQSRKPSDIILKRIKRKERNDKDE